MSDIAIKTENISKLYRIGSKQESYRTLRDVLTDAIAHPFGAIRSRFDRPSHRRSNGDNEVWALKDVSFEVKRGEVVGIIGPNGAGKSTLLKVLSRITEPTKGYADIHGRIGSLLEVGTGFHPELTGRENLYLNGAIIGMKKTEIERKFDEIVAFAEVEEFIDTPVKHYSSGMYLRLAFAVAAHLEPETLLIDEVLAVGDVAFQKKCLGKMGEVAKQGRTVLFVSHNMGAVKELCRKGILLNGGKIVYQGDSSGCIAEYFKQLDNGPALLEREVKDFAIGQIEVKGDRDSSVSSAKPFKVTLPLAGEKLQNSWMFFIIEDFTGRMLVHSRVNSQDLGCEIMDGVHKLELDIPALWLSPGIYAIYFKFLLSSAGASSGRVVSDKFMLDVCGEPEQSGKAPLHPKIEWTLSEKLATVRHHA